MSLVALAIQPISARENNMLSIEHIAKILDESVKTSNPTLTRVYSEGNHLVLEMNMDNLSPVVVDMIKSLNTQEDVDSFKDIMKKEVITEMGNFSHSLNNMLTLLNADIIIRISLQNKPIDILITPNDLN